MKGLSRESRALLDAARSGDEPSAVDRKRVRKGLARKIAVGGAAAAVAATATHAAAGGMATGTSSASAGAAIASGIGGATSVGAVSGVGVAGASAGATSFATGVLATGFGAKVLASVALLGVMGAGTVGYVRHESVKQADAAKSVVVQVARPARPSPANNVGSTNRASLAVRTPASTPEVLATKPSSPESTPLAPPMPEKPAPVAKAVGVSAAPPLTPIATASASPDLNVELALLQDVHRALQANDGARALALLDEHARRFPDGALAEESEAARVFALRQVGRADEARDVAARFLREHPRSPLAPRVTRAFDADPSTF